MLTVPLTIDKQFGCCVDYIVSDYIVSRQKKRHTPINIDIIQCDNGRSVGSQ